jgi:hypothetical protein
MDDTGLLVDTGGVTSQLEDLSGQVFHDGSQVDGSSCTNVFNVRSLVGHLVDTTDGDLKSSRWRGSLTLSLRCLLYHDEIY